MNRTKNKKNSDWKDGFLFLGNQLALDFLNTFPVQNGQPMELLPDFGALLRWFQAAGLLTHRDAASLGLRWEGSGRARRTVDTVHELRERLRTDVVAWERTGKLQRSTVEELNRLMMDYPMSTRLKASRRGLTTELHFTPQHPEDLFAPLVYGAATLFANVNRKRVRKCDQCVLHFLDISKKGTRRWCSMQLCGNRIKVAAYAARQHTLGGRRERVAR